MYYDHKHELHNAMKNHLRAGITPALFEMDALRLDEMRLRLAAPTNIRKGQGTVVDFLRSTGSRISQAILLWLHNFMSHRAMSGNS